MKMYRFISPEYNNFDIGKDQRSPIIKVENGFITSPRRISLEGLSIDEWFKENPNELKYTYINLLGDKSERAFFQESFYLTEVKLDYSERFKITQEITTPAFYREINQYKFIINSLRETFKVVEPIKNHKKVYGLMYRNIILLSCMEFEVHSKELLRLNSYNKKKTNTSDYVKLTEFINFNIPIYLLDYPDFGEINPYQGWSPDNPTKSIEWYNDYNYLKHDRNAFFYLSTLESALNSISAIKMLLIIRYGQDIIEKNLNNDLLGFNKYINVHKHNDYYELSNLKGYNELEYFKN